MQIKNYKISEVNPALYNPRKITDSEFHGLVESIKKFGIVDPLIINVRDGKKTLVGGHQRLKAIEHLGFEEVPCVEVDLSLSEEKALNVALNSHTIQGKFDEELLPKLLEEIKIDLPDLYGDLNLPDLEIDFPSLDVGPVDGEDDVPEVGEDIELVSKRGDVWLLGGHRVMCGDATNKGDVELLMAGEKADMVFTDPPYGVSYADKNEYLNSIGKPMATPNAIQNDSKTPEQMFLWWKLSFKNLCDFSTNEMSYYITAPQGGDLLLLLQAIRDSGFQLKHILCWAKNNHVLGRCDYNYKHEPIVYGWKQKGIHNFYGKGSQKTSIWEFDKPLKSDLHPTMKPIGLMENALLNSSKKSDIVLDLFLGSGSTLIACEKTKRKCYGMEIDEKYCDVIINRWQNFTGKQATLEATGLAYDEIKDSKSDMPARCI